MEKPLVSFILTYYNLPVEMLCKCIDSILTLSLRPSEREVIVVDDGSESSPMNNLMQFGEDIIYVRQQNEGLSVARNTGIQMATGEYLQFVDGDDQLIMTAYEHCIDAIRLHHPEMLVFDFTKTATGDKSFHDGPLQSGSDYMRYNNIRGTACGYLFKRSILGNLRFTPGIFHEDEEFTPQLLLRAETVCVTDAQAYLYCERPNSITTDNRFRKVIKRLEDLKGVIYRLHTIADRLPTNDKAALQRRVAQLTMDYLYNIIQQTKSRRYLDSKIAELRKIGLFPLPYKEYTTKYTWFRRMTNNGTGLSILLFTIPLMNKER